MNRRIEVDLTALAANFELLQDMVAPARCAAVVKADAYGLGIRSVAEALAGVGCDAFFVATAEESIELRKILDEVDIFTLEGISSHNAAELRKSEIIPVLNSLDQASTWADFAPNRKSIVHIDSGMCRLGMPLSDIRKIASNNEVLGALKIDYLMTHLACADEPYQSYNSRQLSEFEAARALLPGCRTSIGNSSGIFLGTKFCGDMVRTGIALYGGNPQPAGANPMREVVRIQGRIIQIRDIEHSTGVGYGATATVRAPARLATVAFGYADGYWRSLGNNAEAIVGNMRVPVIGRVSMDSLMLDVSNVPDKWAEVGRWATLVGDGLTLDEVAANSCSISYELLVGIGRRVQRKYKMEAKSFR